MSIGRRLISLGVCETQRLSRECHSAMALIQNIERTRKERHEVHKPTRCLASGFTSGTQRFIQLDTYGSDAREFPDKVSQSLQFDEAAARQLLELIEETFPSLGEKRT